MESVCRPIHRHEPSFPQQALPVLSIGICTVPASPHMYVPPQHTNPHVVHLAPACSNTSFKILLLRYTWVRSSYIQLVNVGGRRQMVESAMWNWIRGSRMRRENLITDTNMLIFRLTQDRRGSAAATVYGKSPEEKELSFKTIIRSE